MRIGMFTSGYQYYPLEYAFRDAKRIGYDYIELWGGRPHAFPYDLERGELVHVQRLMDQYEIPVSVYTPEHNAYPYNYMIGNKEQRRDAIGYLKTAIRMGKAMGAKYTLISAGHGGYLASRQELEERLCKSVEELADYADQIGTKIILESLTGFETNVCTMANDVSEVLRKVNSPSLFGMCDVVVPFVQNEPVMNYFEKLGEKCVHLHLVDSDGCTENHVLPGDGQIPLAELLEEIRDYGYDKTATIELVTAYRKEPYLYAKRAFRRVKDLI